MDISDRKKITVSLQHCQYKMEDLHIKTQSDCYRR